MTRSEAGLLLPSNLTLLTGFGGEEKFIRPLLDQYEARIDSPEEFAIENRVLLLRDTSGV